MEKKYNYKSCSSLFGYSAKVHIRFKGQCQLCKCGGGNPVDFDLWRQMTVEHLIGKSQGGYLKQILIFVEEFFPMLNKDDIKKLAIKIDEKNTITCCQFCNSTTCRYPYDKSMKDLFIEAQNNNIDLIEHIDKECQNILKKKQEDVKNKLSIIKEAFKNEVLSRIN
ncbi:MAG TPA: hypothetical protein VLZ29_02330 [Sulfurimonas sp.]|uniref:hypothetical protein n=1 Tax=Sulfurimonas sp. TaxID=2022749 RepID=UPI002C25DC47|nr:hypothetical protein [Sulfurimonas sp.]HUH41931.1 hypothetical protein [Sulfurimonas sp.]